VEHERQPRRPPRLEAEEKDHAELAEVMESADHPRRGDGGAEGRQEDIGHDEEVRDPDVIGEEEDPIIKDDAEPDDEGQQGVQGEMAAVTEELESIEKLAEKPYGGVPGALGQGFQEERDDADGLLPAEIEQQRHRQDGRGHGDAESPPEGQPLSGLLPDGPGRGEEGPGEEEQPEEQAHGEHVEDPLHDDRADGKAGPQVLLAGEVERLDQLAQPAGEKGADREADNIGRQEVPEAHVKLLGGDEHVPARGPGDKLGGRQGDDQQEERQADVGDGGRDLVPRDAAPEKEEEAEHQGDDGGDLQDIRSHGRGQYYHEIGDAEIGDMGKFGT